MVRCTSKNNIWWIDDASAGAYVLITNSMATCGTTAMRLITLIPKLTDIVLSCTPSLVNLHCFRINLCFTFVNLTLCWQLYYHIVQYSIEIGAPLLRKFVGKMHKWGIHRKLEEVWSHFRHDYNVQFSCRQMFRQNTWIEVSFYSQLDDY